MNLETYLDYGVILPPVAARHQKILIPKPTNAPSPILAMAADPAFTPHISTVSAALANPSPPGILSELQQKPHLRTRRRTPKVKTGCHTCRTRRVKCDESKPVCKKCEKLCVSCSYPILVEKPKQRPRQSITKLHPLVPKARASQPTTSIRICEVKPRLPFTDENEARYFMYYCEGMSKQIGGPFSNKLWDHLIPQAGEGVPFIGRAVIALGALSKSQSLGQKENRHHSYALAQYVQALKGMRNSIAENPGDIRTAIIGCLLVFCFESLQGHHRAASLHASSGVDLIASLRTRCAPKSWKDSEIGAELYSAFSGLNLQSLLLLDQRTVEKHRFYKVELGKAAAAMPEEFENLEECRRFWHYLMRRNLHFSLEVRDSLANSFASSESPSLESTGSLCNGHTSSNSPKLTFLLAERKIYVRDICRWEIASAPILCRLFIPSYSTTTQDRNTETGKEGGEDFLTAALLRIHAAMNIIHLSRTFNPPESAYDRFLDQFRMIVELSERIHHLLVGEEGGGRVVFRFEIGILPALSQVGLLCREREIRRRAIRLLQKSKGYKEGIWDAEVVGAVGEWVRDLEEEGLGDGEEVGEENRVQMVGCDMKVMERWANVRIRRGDGETREEVVRW